MPGRSHLSFDKILQTLEKECGLTEKEILKKIRVARSTYRGWRDGYSEPSKREHYIRLADVFGTHGGGPH